MFKLSHECGSARVGSIVTSHGGIATPAMLMTVRKGDVHGLTPDSLDAMDSTFGRILNPFDLYGEFKE